MNERSEVDYSSKMKINGDIMEEVNRLEYPGSILCKYGNMEWNKKSETPT